MLEQKLQEAVNRYKEINKYGKKMIMEQDVPTPEEPAGDVPPTEDVPPVEPAPVDTPTPETPISEPETTEEIDKYWFVLIKCLKCSAALLLINLTIYLFIMSFMFDIEILRTKHKRNYSLFSPPVSMHSETIT